MAGLLANDQVLMDDIVGLLDFDAPLTPKVSTTTNLNFIPVASSGSPSSGSSDDCPTTNKRSVKREQEKVRQRRHRQRLKDSRDELQSQVDALTEQLERLKQEAAARKKKTEETETGDSQLACAQRINEARHQRNQRLEAEAQQRQLIAAMNHQAEYIKSLREMHNARGGGVLPTLYTMPGALYATYLQQLDGCYARVDAVMNACGIASLPETTLNTVHKRASDGGVAFFQHVNKVVLPYSFRQTCQVLQEVVNSQEDAPTFGGFEVAPDKYVVIKSREITTPNVGSLAERYVSRQYFEDNRMVLVWKVSSEGEEGFRGLHAEETGWICVEPSPGGGVVLSVCVEQVPMHFASPYSPEPATRPFYRLLGDCLEADKDVMSARLGSMLLEDVLAGIEC